jgi:hypothetical protein
LNNKQSKVDLIVNVKYKDTIVKMLMKTAIKMGLENNILKDDKFKNELILCEIFNNSKRGDL